VEGDQERARRQLLGWLDQPAPDRGIWFAAQDGWDRWSYARLAALTRQVAEGMRRRGLAPGAVVAIVHRSGPGFVAGLFGAMLAGGAAAPIAPPMTFQAATGYQDYLAGLLAGCRPSLIVTEPELADTLRDMAGPAATQVVCVADLTAAADSGSAPAGASSRGASPGGRPSDAAAGLVLTQFTSGSTGVARTVRVPASALLANVTAIQRWLRWTREDPVASWLPVHHDMGLTGCLITPVVTGSDAWLLPPSEFIRRPARYLRCFGESGARLTAMPAFGLEHIVRAIRPGDLSGLDFSAWRAAIIGAEHIEAATLDRFHALLAPHGFSRQALLPAYGLAEATLAATGTPLDEQWRSVTVDARLVPGRPVAPAGGAGDESRVTVVSCGRPLHGVSVRIVGDDGKELPPGWLGEIELRGSSIADGYAGNPSASASRFRDGVLRTGDAGFLAGGELMVLGRLGDSMKIRGRSVFAEDVEAAICQAGVPARRVAVALGVQHGTATAVLVLEEPDASTTADALAAARRRTEHAHLVVVTARRGAIPRTTSGKVRRRRIWEAYLAGALDGSLGNSAPVSG
jgi:acyl-CoA synthetase (AMP-forming)/AMP-acid ligase II